MNYRKVDKRPLAKRQFCYTNEECAAVAGVTERLWYMWLRKYSDIPKPPTSKIAVEIFLDKHELPRPPQPAPRTTQVALLRLEGVSYTQIARRLGMASASNARRCWLAYERRKQRRED